MVFDKVDERLQHDFLKLAVQCKNADELQDFVFWINENYFFIYEKLCIVRLVGGG